MSGEAITPGLVLDGRFEVGREIGRGGMGRVFEGVHRTTGRRVAIKSLVPRGPQAREVAERFMNEVRAAVAISDPHVVEVIDMGRGPDESLYVVLEYLDGRELSRVVEQDQPVPVARAAHIGLQLAGVIGKAHARGIVHRDLKPANVMLIATARDPDFVKVLDFGVAKLARDGEQAPLTRTGQMLGTPCYMPLEQLRGTRDVGPAADVYAIGAILYELLAGRVPFHDEVLATLAYKLMTERPTPLAELRPDVPEELAALIDRAIARDAADRPPDATALADLLAPFAAPWRPTPPVIPRAAPREEPASRPAIAREVGPTDPTLRATPRAAQPLTDEPAPRREETAASAASPGRATRLCLILCVLLGVAALVTALATRAPRAPVAAHAGDASGPPLVAHEAPASQTDASADHATTTR